MIISIRQLVWPAVRALLLVAAATPANAMAEDSLPGFSARALTGARVSSERLVGQPTLLILTPSRDAAQSTRAWIEALRKNIDTSEYLIRDIISIELPFFMSEQDALKKAKDAIPKRYHDQTWLMNSSLLEGTFDIPDGASEACVVVIDHEGTVVEYVYGAMNQSRLDHIVKTLAGLGEQTGK